MASTTHRHRIPFWCLGAAVCLAVCGPPRVLLALGPGFAMDSLEWRRGEKITVARLAEILEIPAHKDRFEAVRAAGELGPDAKPLLPHLIAALSDEDFGIRCNAAHALGEIGPPAAPAAPELVKLLDDENEWVRLNAAGALGRVGDMSSEAVPALIAKLRGNSCSEIERWVVVDSLGNVGTAARDAVPALVSFLRTGTNPPELRKSAAAALGKIAVDPDPSVIAALDDAVRFNQGDDQLGADDSERPDESQVRIAAAVSLWKLGRDARVVPWLMATAQRNPNSAYIRGAAVVALSEIGPGAAAATTVLASLADDCQEERHTRMDGWEAISALGRIGPGAKSAIPTLVRHVDLQYGEGNRAIDALGGIGPPAHIAAPLLMQAMASTREYELECLPRMRLSAAVALRKVGADTGPTVPVLIALLTIQETMCVHSRFFGRKQAGDIRRQAAIALGELGATAHDAIPALNRLLADDFITVREAAELSISRIEAAHGDR